MRLLIPILLLAVSLGCTSSGSPIFSLGTDVSVNSPSGKMIATSAVVSETLLLVNVTDVDSGANLASVNTNVSRIHRWSLMWHDDETILIRSSDVGPIAIKLQPNGNWKTGSALRTTSPDQRFVALSRSSPDPYSSASYLAVSLLHIDADGDASSVVVQFDTQLEITDDKQLEFCTTWVGGNRLEAKIGNQFIAWTEQPDGSWIADDKTKFDLIQ